MQRTMPKEHVVEFVVNTVPGIRRFRRAGIEFDETPKTVKASDLTFDQQIELLNTHTLEVEQIDSPAARAADFRARRAAAGQEDDDQGDAGDEDDGVDGGDDDEADEGEDEGDGADVAPTDGDPAAVTKPKGKRRKGKGRK